MSAFSNRSIMLVKKALEDAGVECKYQPRVPLTVDAGSEPKWTVPDFIVEMPWGLRIVEVDECQHRSYNIHPRDDVIRDFHLARSLPLQLGQKLQIIRYNPDAFFVDGVDKRVPQEQRLARLLELVADQTEPVREFERLFLYYDSESDDELPVCSAVWDDIVAKSVSRVVW